jgi:hypothetical protein
MIIQNKYNSLLQGIIFAVVLLLSAFGIKAQVTPGGIPASAAQLELWLKADVNVSNVGGSVYQWTDNSDRRVVYSAPADRYPTWNATSNLMNFWPSVEVLSTSVQKAIAQSSHFLVNNRSYYVFFVSAQDPARINGTRAVYTFNCTTTASGANYVGWSEGKPLLFVNGQSRIHQGNGKQYGIVAAMIPNSTATGALVPHVYLNGVANSASFATRAFTFGAGFGTVGSIRANTTATAYSEFKGSIQEIIVFSGPLNSYLNQENLLKVNSYLALKYGIDMDIDEHYVNSDGTNIWSRTVNSGYNKNVFGLGRDDKSGLYVRQATSYGNFSLTAYLGSSLAALNTGNAGSLNNNTFVVFGSNGATGVGNYLWDAPNTDYANGRLAESVEYQYKEKFRVQLTGITGITLNLKASNQEANLLFVSSSPNFDPSVTRFYKLNSEGVASNVPLANGDYIIYAKEEIPWDPADITKIRIIARLVADEDMSFNGSRVSGWGSIGGQYFFRQTTAARQPYIERVDSLMNFQPAVKFWGNTANPSLGLYNLATPAAMLPIRTDSSYYTFVASEATTRGNVYTSPPRVIFAAGNNYFGWYKNNPSFTSGNTGVPNVSGVDQKQFQQDSTLQTKEYGIMGIIRPNSLAIPQSIYFNGDVQTKPGDLITGAGGSNVNAYIGKPTDVATSNQGFIGKLSEMLLFVTGNTPDKQISEKTVGLVNSYLAIKYGITLELGDYRVVTFAPFTYVPSLLKIWDRDLAIDSKGTRYESTIFGIGATNYSYVYSQIPDLPPFADLKKGILGLSNLLSFDQRQSRAFNEPYPGPFTVFTGSELKVLNKDKRAAQDTIPVGSYLMFSADQNVRGVISLSEDIPANTPFRNTTPELLPTAVNKRTALFKTQGTNWNSTLVRFHNNLNMPTACYLLISDTPDLDPSTTDMYPFDGSGNTQAINLGNGNGKYITIVTNAPPRPGGVYGELRLWMRADSSQVTFTTPGATGYKNKISEWRDYSERGIKFNRAGTTPAVINRQPAHFEGDPRMNYHPSIVLNDTASNTAESLTSTTGIMSQAAPAAYTFFTVLNNNYRYNAGNGTDNRSYPMGFGGTEANSDSRFPAFGVLGNLVENTGVGRIVDQGGGAGESITSPANGKLPLFKPSSTIIMVHQVVKNQKIRYAFDAAVEDIYHATIGIGSKMNTSSILGGGSTADRYLHGPLAELFAYERVLSLAETDAIYSYLGFKYGITIDRDKSNPYLNFDYFLSSNKIVWPGNTVSHVLFHNNVAALVRDDDGGLDNKRSHSTAEGSSLFMGYSADNGATWKSLDVDKSALVWGNDSIALDSVIVLRNRLDVCGGLDLRLQRVYLVDNSVLDASGSEPTSIPVILRWGGEYSGRYGNAGYQAYMLVGDEEEDFYRGSVYPYDDATHNWNEIIPGNFVNGEHQFKYTFTQKHTYLTFGFVEVGGGCPTCGFSGNKVLDFSTWRRGQASLITNLGDGFSSNVTVTNAGGATSTLTAYTNKTLRIQRNGNSSGIITTEINLGSNAAGFSFEIYGLTREASSRYDKVEIVGVCQGVEVYPDLFYTTNAKNSSYTILRNTLTGKPVRAPAYTAAAGRALVRFDHPINKVVIKYSLTGRSATSRATGQIGIGPVSFSCPPPLPPLNEAGFSFTKAAPKNQLSFCEKLEYTFVIRNSNCDPKYVHFEDQLPANMFWKEIKLGNAEEPGVTVIYPYEGQRMLRIDSLALQGGRNTVITAVADFLPTATAGVYENYAKINYIYIKDDIETPGELYSCDASLGCGVPTRVTMTGTMTDRDLKPIEYTLTCNRDCFSGGETLEYTMTFKNDNSRSFSDLHLDMSVLPPEFVIDGNVMGGYEGSPLSPLTLLNEDGYYSYENWTINANSTYKVTFKVKVPAKASLPVMYDENGDPLLDGNGDPIISDLSVDFALWTEDADPCVQLLFEDAADNITLTLCRGKNAVISNKNVTSTIKK